MFYCVWGACTAHAHKVISEHDLWFHIKTFLGVLRFTCFVAKSAFFMGRANDLAFYPSSFISVRQLRGSGPIDLVAFNEPC